VHTLPVQNQWNYVQLSPEPGVQVWAFNRKVVRNCYADKFLKMLGLVVAQLGNDEVGDDLASGLLVSDGKTMLRKVEEVCSVADGEGNRCVGSILRESRGDASVDILSGT
jgi:hypothetical protein